MRLIGIIIIILVLVVYYLNTVKESFKVSFKLDDIPRLKDFTLQNLNSGTSFVQIRILFVIFYNAFARIVFSDLRLKIYYNGVLVAESANVPENFKTIILLPNVNNFVYYTFDIKINSSAIDLVGKIKAELPYQVNYLLTAKVFGIPINLNKIYSA